MQLILIDLGLGNIVSVESWLKRLPVHYEVVNADKYIEKNMDATYILPGVSDSVMYVEVLNTWLNLRSIISGSHFKKLIAVCAGYQALCERVTENGRTITGLSVVPAYSTDEEMKSPHNGWAKIRLQDFDLNIYDERETRTEVYFNHSCGVFASSQANKHFDLNDKGFSNHFLSEKIVGLQYHPEKSGKLGVLLGRRILGV